MILDVNSRTLSDGSVHMVLGPVGTSLLCALSRYKIIMTYDSIITAVYEAEPSDAYKAALCVLVSRIRERATKAGFGRLIETHSGIGFSLSASISITETRPPITIPGRFLKDLERLLHSHPNHVAADRVLAALACA